MLGCVWLFATPLGSSVHGILQARILEWVAIPFSRGPSWLRDQTWVSCIAGRFSAVWTTWEAPIRDWEWLIKLWDRLAQGQEKWVDTQHKRRCSVEKEKKGIVWNLKQKNLLKVLLYIMCFTCLLKNQKSFYSLSHHCSHFWGALGYITSQPLWLC